MEVKNGDIWQLGRHRLMCGDCYSQSSRTALLDGIVPDMLLSDPPYGIDWNTDYTRFSGGVRPSTNRYKKIVGDASPFDPTPFLGFKNVVLWGANHYADKLPKGSWLVWDKRFKNGKAFLADGEVAWTNHGRGVYIKSITNQGFVSPDGRRYHPTQKPVKLFEWCIERLKHKPNILYDPFLGSGTAILAAEATGKTCYGFEIDPQYCSIILDRYTAATSIEPVLLNHNDFGNNGPDSAAAATA
ncbi:DNA methyltransferase [Methanocella sp. MCL-LM]|uniref:DNA methyltransferase n=1 Tax=Methanocella sp. MCL-LM TaxID=3412035 RepID=UPI003C731F55